MHKSPFNSAAWLWLTAGLAAAGVRNPSRDIRICVHVPLPVGSLCGAAPGPVRGGGGEGACPVASDLALDNGGHRGGHAAPRHSSLLLRSSDRETEGSAW